MNDLQNKTGTNVIIFVIVLVSVLLFIAVVIRVKEQEKDSTLYELYDPLEPQEIRDCRHIDTVYLNMEIDSQEIAVGYLKSNGALKGITE